MPKTRKFSPRRRPTKLRDARLIIIATEGEYTEKQYFEALKKHYRSSRIHVEILPTGDDGKSSPVHVLQRLREIKAKEDLRNDDEFWMVIDRDNWSEENLSHVAAQCHQAGYRIADSNPCFEMWLLLHVVDFASYYSESKKQELYNNPKVSNDRRVLDKELVEHAGSHNKSKLQTDVYLPHVEVAVERARLLDTNADHRWLHTAGSRVYLLVESIKDSK